MRAMSVGELRQPQCADKGPTQRLPRVAREDDSAQSGAYEGGTVAQVGGPHMKKAGLITRTCA